MSENVAQTSFSAGELAPSIYARTDLAAYHQGLAVCRNFFVDYRSGVSTRSGTAFVIQARQLGARLLPFSVSVTSTYILEFGDHYVRFINNGAPVLEAPFLISNIARSNPATVSATGNNFNIGDWVFITGVSGMLAIDNRYAIVTGGGTNLILSDVNGNAIDSSAFNAYTGGGTISRVYTISSPYAAADLLLLKFVESVSVLYLTHPSYPPTTLSFIAPTNWIFTTIVFGTTIGSPSSVTVGVNIVTAPVPTTLTTYQYSVTAIDATGQEGLPTLSNQITVNGNIATTAGTATITWPAVAGAVGYNIYKAEISYSGTIPAGASFGFVGLTNGNSGTTFIDSNIAPDFSNSPPVTNNMPFASNNNPSCVVFFQQRAWYASTTTQQATFWGSQPGAFNNFNQSDPIQDDDEITGTIVSTQLNSIRSMLPMPGGLIMLSGKAAFTLSSGQGANATLAVTPANATIVPQAYNGSSDVPPVVVNEDILYVQAKGAIVRDLSYNIYAAIYTGTDVSIRSNHLFFNHQILQWTWAEEPFKTVWSIRDDGIALALCFMKEQQISGWSRHDTQGLYKSVASVQEGQSDATYFIIQRFLPNGTAVEWIERQASRTFTYGVEDAWSVDAGTGNRDSLPAPAANLRISSATGSTTITASAAVFSLSSVGQVLRADGGIISITSYVSPTSVAGTVTKPLTTLVPNLNIPAPVTSGSWTLSTPATQFWGFDYLIGQSISILADGGVVPAQVVAFDGSISLPAPATKVIGGLGYQCQGKTMPLDVGEPTVQGKRKKIGALNFKLADTRGLKAGRTFNTLVYLKEVSVLNTPAPLFSGDARVIIDPLWDVPGQICFQVDDPVPATVLGIIPEYVIGDSK
jgi:hypothetical protein